MTSSDLRPLSAFAEVQLGRQRSPEHAEGPFMTPYLRAANVKDGYLDLSDVNEMNFTPAEQQIFSLRRGDVLVSEGAGSLAAVGASAVWDGSLGGVVCFQNTLLRLRPRSSVASTRFLAWWARHAYASGLFASLAIGVNIYHLSADRVRALPVRFPSIDVQVSVADVLDHETARIDGLIRRRRDLLRLLSLRRSAFLANAVLGRLNPTAEIVMTARPELPELPQGWRAVRLRSVATEITVGVVVTPAAFYADEGLPFLRGYNIRPGVVTDHDLAWISPESNAAHPKSILRPGDVLVVRTGQAGAAAVVPDWAVGGNCVDVLIVRCSPSLRPKFLELVLNSEHAARQVEAMSVGAIQSHFNVAALRELTLPLPPVVEQDRLIPVVEHEIGRMRQLVVALNHQIGLLGEHRQALITAAVTGQMDVAPEVALMAAAAAGVPE